MLEFDRFGYLKPHGAISSDIMELEKYFVIEYSSVERSRLFVEYLRYCNDLKALCANKQLHQWINGSFIARNKPRPNDIDLVTFLETDIFQKLGHKLNPFIYPNSKENYPGVDAYVVEIKSHITELDKAYWHHQFDTTKRNVKTGKKLPKGFLEIFY